jgi:transposase
VKRGNSILADLPDGHLPIAARGGACPTPGDQRNSTNSVDANGSHHWGRLLSGMGHRVKLIPPQYVKPFVKRSKNDRNDAEAICEAASRPTMRTVPVKSLDEQAATIILRHRDQLLGQRTQTINALRGHAAEFGIVAAKGEAHVKALLAAVAAATDVPPKARAMLARMGQHIDDLTAKLAELDRELSAVHKSNPISQRLAAVPGVGPVTAVTMALSINAEHFQSGRHFAAWLGLTPQEHSTGGKQRIWSWSCPGLVDISGAFGVGRLGVGPFVFDWGLVPESRVAA